MTFVHGQSLERRGQSLATGLVLPTWSLLLLVFALPLLMAVYLSVRNEQIGGFIPAAFVGIENFRSELSSPIFWESFRTTLTIMFLGLVLQVPVGLGLALVLYQQLWGTRFFRSALLIPMLLLSLIHI